MVGERGRQRLLVLALGAATGAFARQLDSKHGPCGMGGAHVGVEEVAWVVVLQLVLEQLAEVGGFSMGGLAPLLRAHGQRHCCGECVPMPRAAATTGTTATMRWGVFLLPCSGVDRFSPKPYAYIYIYIYIYV